MATDLLPSGITCLIDSREQKPLDLSPMKTVRGTLTTGDYSVVGLTNYIAIERKELSDLIMCVGAERERFEKEIQRMLSYETRAIVVEASWADLEAGGWRSRVSPKAAMGSVLSWLARGVPVVMAGGRDRAARVISHTMFLAARRRWRELQQFQASVVEEGADGGDEVHS